LILFLILPPVSFAEHAVPPAKVMILSGNHTETYHVVRVIDAKTIELSNGERIRLIGVDGPDSENHKKDEENAKRLGIDLAHYQSFREKASAFIKRSIGSNQLRVEFDERHRKKNDRDREGRLLAYLYIETLVPDTVDVSEDDWYLHVPHQGRHNVFLNASLIRAGFCFTNRNAFFKHKDTFVLLEEEAKRKGHGLWDRHQSS
jgi:micrococcal nuclease